MPQFGFGAGSLWGLRTDLSGQAPVRFGALQDIQLDFSGDLKPLYGQGQFALALGRGKTKIEGKAKAAQINGALFNSLYFGATLGTGQTLVADGEIAAIPQSTPYQVSAANAAAWQTDLGVLYAATGLPLVPVASAPAQGQYTVASGQYGFNAADKGLSVLISYGYAATSGSRIVLANPRMGTTPTFQVVVSQQYQGKQATFTLNNCVAAKLSLPSKTDDWLIYELDFDVAADPSGAIGAISFAE